MKFKLAFFLISLVLISGCLQAGQPTVRSQAFGSSPAPSDAKIIPIASQPASLEANNLNQPTNDTTMANPIAVFETNKGTFKAEIFRDKVPLTADNFIHLAGKGFYNNLTFHRVIPDFMIQGGDPKGDGTGGPGYEIRDEFSPSLKHSSKGILSMANAGPDTGGSQFFITLGPTPWLDGKHAIFGKIVEGMDVVDSIGKVQTGSNDRPISPVVIKKLTIQ